MRKLSWQWSFLLVSIMVIVITSHFLFEYPLESLFNGLPASTASPGIVAALVILGLLLDILLPVPSSLLSVWAVVALGFAGGFTTVWAGLSIACVFGYWLGAGANTWMLKKFVKTRDMLEVRRLGLRYGDYALVLLRAVPVLAEVSVLSAGLIGMPFRRFFLVTSLSNAGVALVYAVVSEYLNAEVSFIGVIAAGVAVPAAAWTLSRLFRALPALRSKHSTETEADIRSTFSIDFSYPVFFTHDIFSRHNDTLFNTLNSRGGGSLRALFVIDSGVHDATPDMENKIKAYCDKHAIDYGNRVLILPGGEAAKTQAHISLMHREMLERGLDRQSCIIAVGGGALLDSAGFAASTFHRGLRLIRVPTTVLAQNDAGIGVKNGINACGIKNLMGCFNIPHAVINDDRFLETLSDRVFRSGFAEAVKVALIRDARFFNWIESNVGLLNRREQQATRILIKRCAELHIQQISRGGDPFETGNGRPLDYGHWSAHKLESLSHHHLLHGEAVAIGMALDAFYAVEIGLLGSAGADRIVRLLQQLGFDLWHPAMLVQTEEGENALLNGLEEFRQHLGGELCISLLEGIGREVQVNTVDTGTMLNARNKLYLCARHQFEHLPETLDEIDSIA